MRYIISCLLIFFTALTYAQKSLLPEDKAITDLYADTVSNTYLQRISTITLHNDSALLVKLQACNVNAFKKQFRQQIKRQINAEWFIVEDNKEHVEKSLLAENFFIASGNWKLSPTILNKAYSIDENKKFDFFVEVKNSSLFKSLIDQYKQVASVISIQSDVNIFRIQNNFIFRKKIIA